MSRCGSRKEPSGFATWGAEESDAGIEDALALQESYQRWFGDKKRLSRNEILDFLNAHRDRSQEMKELYGKPENLLDQAEANAQTHPFYRHIFNETRN